MTTTTAAAATSTCGPSTFVLPTKDAACGLPNSSDNSAAMDKCCKPASVKSYSGDCGLYCLAKDQSLRDLLSCLTDNGVNNGDVFCNDRLNATATTNRKEASKTDSESTSDSTSSTSSSMANVQTRMSYWGWGVLAMVLGSVVWGTF